MNRRIKAALATATLGLVIGAPAVDSPEVTTLTAGVAPAALAAPAASAVGTRPLIATYVAQREVRREEITTPGAVSVYAVWRNGKVWRVTVPQRQYQVTLADGSTLTHISEGGSGNDIAKQLPPYDPTLDRPPNAAEMAEMDRIANGR